MLTSRLPRDPAEIAYCVSLLKHSPYWQGTSLTEVEVTDCWEALLKSGLGLIDIIHNTDLDPFLVNPTLGQSNPHFERGHGCVFFDCFVTFEEMKKLVDRTDDSEDALMYVLKLYHEHRLDPAKPSPFPSLGSGNEAPPHLHGLSVALFHPALDFREKVILDGSPNFNKVVDASMRHAFRGLGIDSWMNIVANDVMVPLYEHFGNILLRPYRMATPMSNQEKKFMFFMCKDDSVCGSFEVVSRFNYRNTEPIGRYLFLFAEDERERKAKLTSTLQRAAYLSWIGFSPVQIAKHLKVREKTARDRLRAAMNAVRDIDVDPGIRVYNDPVNNDWLRQALDDDAIFDVRHYLFPSYPWPKNLRTRRWQ